MRTTIDLNADLGESFGAYRIGADDAIMSSISSANIACGFHGGDPSVMRSAVHLARTHGVAVGAHPGLPDLAGFGRREMRVSPDDVHAMVLYQIGALAAFLRADGARLRHVKAHGALYNMAVRDRVLAEAIAGAVRDFDASLVVFGLPGSHLIEAARQLGLPTAAEGFADRGYEPDGSLTPRSREGAVLHDEETVVARAVRMATEGRVAATDGTDLRVDVDTICTHGDTPGAHLLT